MSTTAAKVVTVRVVHGPSYGSSDDECFGGYNQEYTTVKTTVIDADEDAEDAISLLVSDIVYNSDKTVGFGTEWGISGSSGQHDIAMLKFCTKHLCVLVRLKPGRGVVPESVRKFMAYKDAKFVGIHIKDDLEKLRRDYGVVVKNPVELTELAAREWKKPGFVDLGPRELADKIGIKLCRPEKPFEVIMSNWHCASLSLEQIRNATVDVYAAVEFMQLNQRSHFK